VVAVPEGRFSTDDSMVKSVPVEELVSERTAMTDSWLDADGTRSVTSYFLPHYFQASDSAGLLPIDTTLVPDEKVPGRVRSKANSWSTSFGASTAAEGMQRFDLGKSPISISAVAASEVKPEVSGSSVSYAGLWNATDAVYVVSPIGVDERLVLHSAAAPTRFEFDIAGATPRLGKDGGVDLMDGDTIVATIPPLTVDTADKGPTHPERAGAGFEVVGVTDAVAGGRVAISISAKWLAGLAAEAFPVVIDPTVTLFSSIAQSLSFPAQGGQVSNVVRAGIDSGFQTWRGAAYLTIPTPASGTQPWNLVSAQLHVSDQPGTQTTVPGLTLVGMGPQFPNSAADVNGPVLQPLDGGGGVGNYYWDVGSWVATHSGAAGLWYGFIGNENVAFVPTYQVLTNSMSINYFFAQTPGPTSLSAPVGTISTTTPVLQAIPVIDNSPTVRYRYQVGTESTVTGTLLDSGWVSSASWAVPDGALTDGMTYYARVWDAIGSLSPGSYFYVPPAVPTQVTTFTIKKRLGAGGPSPTDTVGAVPGSTVTPSEGAPSPGVSPASVTVNMLTGNLALSANTHPLSTVSGAAGVTLNYDSQSASGLDGGGRGLYAKYQSGSTLIGQRVDPSINFSWPGSPMGGYGSSGPVTATWTGTVRVPAAVGSWHFGGAINSGTMAITLDGLSYMTLAAGGTPTFGAPTAWAAQSVHSITVVYTSTVTGARAGQLWAWDDAAPATAPQQFVVPASWLSPRVTGLPTGWRLSANPFNGSWTRLDDLGSQAVLHSATGSTANFTRRSDGSYAPPPGISDVLTVAKTTVPNLMAVGEFTLSTGDVEFVFGVDGWVRKVFSLSDDRHPAALQYGYTTVPGTVGAPVLTSILDPVGNRSITMCYGAAACDTAGFLASNAPPGMLARINHWDGTSTTLVYDILTGQFVRLVNPGGVTADFGYDSVGRLNAIRDPLAYDAIAAGQRTDCLASALTTPTCATQIAYDSAGRVIRVTQPAPTAGDLRTSRFYAYPTADTATVSVSGFNPASGYASSVKSDSQGRIIEQRDSVGRLSRTIWNATTDRPLATIDPAGLQTVSVYDGFTQRLTDSYGPAPSTCFSATAPYAPAGPCAVVVPHTVHRYDEGINALAATFWDNPYFAGAPKLHGTGPGGTGPSGPGCSANTMCTQWNTLPVTPSGVTRSTPYDPAHLFTWSMRLTGIITMPTSFVIHTATTQRAVIFLNGVQYSDVEPPTANTEFIGNYGEWWVGPASNPPVMPAGQYRIQVDFTGSNTTKLNGLWLDTTGFMPNSVLSPDYSLETTSIDPDGKTTATSYTDAATGIGPEFGLPTAVTRDPAGLALATTTKFEPPTSGRWLRKTSSTLPAGTSTAYSHYCSMPTATDCDSGKSGALATACGVTAGAPQWGLLAQQTDPAPSPTGAARTQQFLYDALGRSVGRRVGSTATIATAPWQCTSFDGRGRVTTHAFPAVGASVARTVSYTYAEGGNPLQSSVSDPNGIIFTTVDILGRVVSYTDAASRTTTYAYDTTGRSISTTSGGTSVRTQTYDTNSGQLATVQFAISGQTQASATVTYDPPTGRMTSVSYASATGVASGDFIYDGYGAQKSVTFVKGGTTQRIVGNQVTRTAAGRQIDNQIDVGGAALVDPNPVGDNLVYDGAGRLTSAFLNGGRADYGYADNPTTDNCATLNPGATITAGKNTNRTAVTWTPTTGPVTSTHSCFNTADQLVATITTAASTAYGYDTRGNQTSDGQDVYAWDSADRLVGGAAPTATVTYIRDPLDRLIQRTEAATTSRYSYDGFSDTPAALLDGLNNVAQEYFRLPGGVLVTVDRPSLAKTWSYPNLQGHYVATSDNTGTRTGNIIHYDPWGAELPAGATVNNVATNIDLAAYGTHGKLEEHATTKPLILMGARPLSPTSGRFLTVDPRKGGCANDYTYGYGDPLNGADYTGLGFWDWVGDAASAVGDAWDATGGKLVTAIDQHTCAFAKALIIAGVVIATGGLALEMAEVAYLAADIGWAAAISETVANVAAGAISAGTAMTAVGGASYLAGNSIHRSSSGKVHKQQEGNIPRRVEKDSGGC
jgi:RHS repeat-associated protein